MDADGATHLDALADAVRLHRRRRRRRRRLPGGRRVGDHRAAQPRSGLWGAALYRRCTRAGRPGIADTQCGFKVFRGDLARAVFADLRSDRLLVRRRGARPRAAARRPGRRVPGRPGTTSPARPSCRCGTARRRSGSSRVIARRLRPRPRRRRGRHAAPASPHRWRSRPSPRRDGRPASTLSGARVVARQLARPLAPARRRQRALRLGVRAAPCATPAPPSSSGRRATPVSRPGRERDGIEVRRRGGQYGFYAGAAGPAAGQRLRRRAPDLVVDMDCGIPVFTPPSLGRRTRGRPRRPPRAPGAVPARDAPPDRRTSAGSSSDG